MPLAWQAPLSSAQLVGLSKSERDELLGQRLLGLVAIVDPEGADKITSVLLEMQVQPVDTHADVHRYIGNAVVRHRHAVLSCNAVAHHTPHSPFPHCRRMLIS